MFTRLHDSSKNRYQLDILLSSSFKDELALAFKCREDLTTNIAELNELKHTIELLQLKDSQEKGLQTALNIGRDFYVDAYVSDVSKILINVGADVFVESGLDEALIIIVKKQKLLEQRLEYLSKQITEIECAVTLHMAASSSPYQTLHLQGEYVIPTIPLVGVINKESTSMSEIIHNMLTMNLTL